MRYPESPLVEGLGLQFHALCGNANPSQTLLNRFIIPVHRALTSSLFITLFNDEYYSENSISINDLVVAYSGRQHDPKRMEASRAVPTLFNSSPSRKF